MMLTMSQYAKLCNISVRAIQQRILRGTISTEIILGKIMINTEKYPPMPKQKTGRKKGSKNVKKKA